MKYQNAKKSAARGQGYRTRQRELIEKTLKALGGKHITAEALTEQLDKNGYSVGRTTVYRCLERLVEDGVAQKYTAIGESACYQYLGAADCVEHFHLKCTGCGRLIHIECEQLSELASHITAEHGFRVDKLKTVLYGLCEECAKK